jgi:hypothetical protein
MILHSPHSGEYSDPVAQTALATMIASSRSVAIGALMLMMLFNGADIAFRD